MLVVAEYTVWFVMLLTVTVISENPILTKLNNPEVQAVCQYDSCGTSSDKMQNVSVTYTPDPLQVNKNVTITFTGNLTEPLDKGKVNAMFTWGTRLEKNETYDLCYLLAKVNHTCPVHPGPFGFTLVTHIPLIVFPGRYGGLVNATDANQKVLFCLTGYCLVTLNWP